MAYASITFENSNTGAIKKAPVGYSWTICNLNFFPALFRGDWKWVIIMIIMDFVVYNSFESFDTVLHTSSILGDYILSDYLVMLTAVIFAFFYNKLYITDLIGKGFKAKSITSSDVDVDSTARRLGIEIPISESVKNT